MSNVMTMSDLESGKPSAPAADYQKVNESDVPVMSVAEKSVRQGFVRKVYGILSCQLLLTVLMAATFMKVESIRTFVITNPFMLYSAMFLAFGLLFALMVKKDEHPTNMYLLAAFTAVEAYTIGVVCATFEANGIGNLVLHAALLTAIVFLSLTVFTMQSKIDFSFMGAGLFSCLTILVCWSFMGALFGFPRGYIFSLCGAVLFSLFIIYDTQMILNRLGPDDYIMASIDLYLDIINLFLFILDLLSRDNR